MTFLGDAAIVLAILLTLPLVGLIHGLRHPRDPQAGVAAIYFFILSAPRWALVLLALGVALSRGAFGWLGVERGMQVFLVVVVHVLAGGASLVAQFYASERCGVWRRNLSLAVAVALPLCASAIALAGVNVEASPGRNTLIGALSVAIVAMTLALGAVLLGGYITDAPRRAAHAREVEQAEAERNAEYYRERDRQLKALAPDEPVYKLIQFTYANEPGDIAPRAREMIAARPNFLVDLAEALRGNACYEAMWFLATGMSQPPAELAEPARDAIFRISEHIRGQFSGDATHYPDQHFGETSRILEVIDKFAASGVDFQPALQHLIETFGVPGADRAEQSARRLIRDWLDRHPASASQSGSR